MNTGYSELSTAAQAAYSELFEAAHGLELRRGVASLSGSFQSKTIHHKVYWYFAFRDVLTGKVRQLYLGPESPAITALRADADGPGQKALLHGQVQAAIAHGCATVARKPFRILRQLADCGFFHAGGLLIGAQAFAALGNMLGVRWRASATTLDIDFAHAGPDSHLALALPADLDADVHGAIEALEMGFLPAATTKGQASGSYTNQLDTGLRLDFLTPLRRSPDPVYAPNLGIHLQPIKFLDYLIERPTQGVIAANVGAVVVNLPDPARFALHKLLVAAERPTREQAKASKDLAQTASLMAWLLDHQPDTASAAWQDLAARGPGWRRRAYKSLNRLRQLAPSTHARWLTIIVNDTRAGG